MGAADGTSEHAHIVMEQGMNVRGANKKTVIFSTPGFICYTSFRS